MSTSICGHGHLTQIEPGCAVWQCEQCGVEIRLAPPAAPAQPEPRTPDETLADAWTRAWDHAGDHREYIHGVAAVGDAMAKRLRELAELVVELADGQPCRYDHHGYCQEHGWTTAGTCAMGRANAIAARARESGGGA